MPFMRATNLPVTSGRWADGQMGRWAIYGTRLVPPPHNSIGSIDVVCLFTGNNILHAGSIFRFNSQCINYLCTNRWLKMPMWVRNCVCSKSQRRLSQWQEEYTTMNLPHRTPCRGSCYHGVLTLFKSRRLGNRMGRSGIDAFGLNTEQWCAVVSTVTNLT
jgi:hypothetical protein